MASDGGGIGSTGLTLEAAAFELGIDLVRAQPSFRSPPHAATPSPAGQCRAWQGPRRGARGTAEHSIASLREWWICRVIESLQPKGREPSDSLPKSILIATLPQLLAARRIPVHSENSVASPASSGPVPFPVIRRWD